MRITLLFLLLAYWTTAAFAQKEKGHRHVAYLQTLRPDKLAWKLTSDLQTDVEKVSAIHSWITHNIKYDITKWAYFDYSPTPTSKVLLKRKANSSDFSQLFYELCSYAQIKSTVIPGYLKNEYMDLTDHFYIDEYSWNAVYVDKEWKLVDACWDAGMIRYYKRTFAGYFIFAFTFGTSDRLVYRPHFVSKPSTQFFLKDGRYFQTDHIPADSLWQLTLPIRSLDQAEADSSYFKQFYDSTSTGAYTDKLDAERLRISDLEERQRQVEDGVRIFAYNPKNNFRIASSYYLLAEGKANEVNPDMGNKQVLHEKRDTVLGWINQSITYCDSNAAFLLRQKLELTNNNLLKKAIITQQNKALLKSTESTLKNIAAGSKMGLSGKILLKTMEQRNKLQAAKVIKGKKYKKTEFAKRMNRKDSATISLQIQQLTLQQNSLDSAIKVKFENLSKLHVTFIKNMQAYAERSAAHTATEKELARRRLAFEDDLDFSLRQIKDTLMAHKFKDDSLLIDGVNGPVSIYFYKEFGTLKDEFNAQYKLNDAITTEYVKLKKTCTKKSDCTEAYEKSVSTYKTEVKQYTDFLRDNKKKFKEMYRISKQQVEPTKAEEHGYIKEKFIEYQLFSTRSGFINRRYKAWLSENKALKSKAVKLKRKMEKISL